jgi:hypothetical protein
MSKLVWCLLAALAGALALAAAASAHPERPSFFPN